MNKMGSKRVFLVRNVNPEFYGGGETYQIKVAEELKKYNFKPYIVTSSLGLLKAAGEKNIEVVHAPFIKTQNWSGWKNILFPIYAFRIFKLRKWYGKIFKQYRPDVINIQSRDDWIAATGVAKKMGIKVLWTDHMDFRSWVLTNVNVWYKNLIGKWILRCAKEADKIIMISDFERKSFEKIAGVGKYNLVTIKNGAKDEREKYGNIKYKKDSICYVGRVVEYKGIRELIMAFRRVLEKFKNVRLNIYGGGEDLEKYKKLARGISEKIVFYGQTDEPLRALNENEIFILPSYREGLSLSLLDAAMMGKKIIASDVDGNPEVIQNAKTGLLVPVKNVKELTKAMMWMLEHKKQADKLAENARKYYKENFDFDKIFVEKMLPLYNIEKEKK